VKDRAKTESKLPIAIGIWIVALGMYAFVLFFLNLHDIESSHYPPIHLPIVFAVGLVTTLFGIWLIRWGFRPPSAVNGGERDCPED